MIIKQDGTKIPDLREWNIQEFSTKAILQSSRNSNLLRSTGITTADFLPRPNWYEEGMEYAVYDPDTYRVEPPRWDDTNILWPLLFLFFFLFLIHQIY